MLNFSIDKKAFDELPENLREHYIENEDGSFRLDTNGESNEAIHGLKSALEKERSERKTFQEKVEQLSGSMKAVSSELEVLRRRDEETSLRRAIAGVTPPTVRDEAFEDLLLLAKSELEISETDGGSSYATKDGKDLQAWMDSVLEHRPYWLKLSTGSGAKGGSSQMGGQTPASMQQLMGEVFQ